jgi:hypothetical protein
LASIGAVKLQPGTKFGAQNVETPDEFFLRKPHANH